MENELFDEDLVVITLPTNQGTVTYAAARLISEDEHAFAEAIVAVPDTAFAPPRRAVSSQLGSGSRRFFSPAELASL